jgi:hypothetical protein
MEHPAVGAAVASVGEARLVERARAIAQAAAARCGVTEMCEEAPDLALLVERLDGVAWNSRDAEERGLRADPPYEQAFRRARAADAWHRSSVATDREAATEVLYEGLHALGGDDAAEVLIIELLGGK